MKIISASRRTDIPAFYSEWFMNRIRDGYVKVMSPFSYRITTVSLRPEDVIAVVFWTKNGRPLSAQISELKNRGYTMYFLYTVNNFPKILEPDTPDLRHTIETMEKISSQFDRKVIRWRYDPIVISSDINLKSHMKNFAQLCSLLRPYTDQCIFSFCDYYKKTIRKMTKRGINFSIVAKEEALNAALAMSEISVSYGISLLCCAHDFLAQNSIKKARCIDGNFISELTNHRNSLDAILRLKQAGSRKECGCLESIDIGAYNTCYHGCVYCYATTDPKDSREKYNLSIVNRDCLDPRFETFPSQV